MKCAVRAGELFYAITIDNQGKFIRRPCLLLETKGKMNILLEPTGKLIARRSIGSVLEKANQDVLLFPRQDELAFFEKK